MFKDYRYINAGENEFYRWGKRAQRLLEGHLIPNEKGFYSIPADGGKYYTFGTSKSKYGEFSRYEETIFPVNRRGHLWAKAGSEKGDMFVEMLVNMIEAMRTQGERGAKKLTDPRYLEEGEDDGDIC